MITGDYDYLNQLAQEHLCAEHKQGLTVAWVSEEKCYSLRCPEGHYPDNISQQLSITAAYRRGEVPAKAAWFDNLERSDLANGQQLSEVQVQALIEYARRYNLDPYRGHVVIYHGKPYIGIDGYLFHANNTHQRYRLLSRPLNERERRQYQVQDGDHAWIATVIKGDDGDSFSGLGIVTQQEMIEKSKRHTGQLRSPVVAAHPWQLAQKRADWQALRRAFPIGETEESNSEARDQS